LTIFSGQPKVLRREGKRTRGSTQTKGEHMTLKKKGEIWGTASK
jgi:hypothetical protein